LASLSGKSNFEKNNNLVNANSKSIKTLAVRGFVEMMKNEPDFATYDRIRDNSIEMFFAVG